MIRKRNLILVTGIVVIIYLFTTNYIFTILNKSENPSLADVTIEKAIFQKLKELPADYFIKSPSLNNLTEHVLNNLNKVTRYNLGEIWNDTNRWVTNTQVIDFHSNNIGNALHALKYSKIIKADLDSRGTQLKLLLTLEGNQQVVFKPKWYNIDKIIEGPVYAGKDRYGSEILGFYLSILLRKPLTPLSVDRDISLKHDVIPVATQRLLDTTFYRNNITCIYGKCFYCKKEDPICENHQFSLTGAVIFNVKVNLKSHRSPWQRTYKKEKKAAWQLNLNYCNIVKSKYNKKRIYDLIDISIFDFILQNGDRHHYETMNDTVLMLDNGKGLGNPSVHHIDILAPLYQCCMLRQETLKTLMYLKGGKLKEVLESVPNISLIVTKAHILAIEERLLLVFATIEYCKSIKRTAHNLL